MLLKARLRCETTWENDSSSCLVNLHVSLLARGRSPIVGSIMRIVSQKARAAKLEYLPWWSNRQLSWLAYSTFSINLSSSCEISCEIMIQFDLASFDLVPAESDRLTEQSKIIGWFNKSYVSPRFQSIHHRKKCSLFASLIFFMNLSTVWHIAAQSDSTNSPTVLLF